LQHYIIENTKIKSTYIASDVISLLLGDFGFNTTIFIIFNFIETTSQDPLFFLFRDLMLCILAPRVVFIASPATPPHSSAICRLMRPTRPVEVLFFIVFLVASGAEFKLQSLERCGFHFLDSSLESKNFGYSTLES